MTECFRSVALCLALGAASVVIAAEPSAATHYEQHVKPLLQARCFACHGVLKQEAGLRLDTARFMQRPDSGPTVVVAGQPAQSELLTRITAAADAGRMPPEGAPLTAEEVAAIRTWIEAGAPAPADEQPEADPRRHWAFQTIQRPAVPVPTTAGWSRTAVDHFIQREYERHGLQPQLETSKAQLLRRVSLDLVGLPPTRDELQAFLADERPDAYEQVVERLLNSPQYGERWGRHWMDVWRYSDWYGRRMVPDVWNSAPQIWRWRDWIVASLNADKGYDRMVSEMLAADELAPGDDEAGYATGYLIRNWYALNPNDWMRSNVEHTGKAFLGLTFNCAHCHDHKYDPITQDEYFKLRAFFEPIGIRQDRVAGEPDPGPFQEYNYSSLRKIVRTGSVRIFDKSADAPTWFYTGGDERNRVADRGSIPPGVPAFLSAGAQAPVPQNLPPAGWYPGSQPAIQATLLADLRKAISASELALATGEPAIAAVLPALQQQLALAENELELARQAAGDAGRIPALSGRHSVLLDATSGRRLIQRYLPQVTSLPEGSSISLQLRILKDAHVNFQLAKDIGKGLTAGYVGFEQGRILSYQPGSFTEFEVGRYDLAAGQFQFALTLDLQPSQDRALLSVVSTVDNLPLVQAVPVAINGWLPAQGISFDARPGTCAALDDIRMVQPTAPAATAAADQPASALTTWRTVLQFDFESPELHEGQELLDSAGWLGSTYSQAPATSRIVRYLAEPAVLAQQDQVRRARSAVAAQSLQHAALTARVAASQAELEGAQARIATDQIRYGQSAGQDAEPAIRAASRQHRAATVLTAQADVLSSEQALAAAEAQPLEAANRAKAIDDAAKLLAVRRDALAKAESAAADGTLDATYPPLTPTYPQTSTGRRLALVQWMTSRQNPLTARVAVNHLWLRHFHSPLVATVSDFGRNGAHPTHPELLDWLAAELMDSGWSMKHLHRLIVTSSVYRLSSVPTDPARQADPENRFLTHMPVGRMEAEVVRDSLLHCADQLNLQVGGQELENTQALTTQRRTLYYSCNPELDGKSAFGMLFDAPEPADCYRRSRSIIPQQALALTNSELAQSLSGTLAANLWESLSEPERLDPAAFVTAASEQILSRAPTAQELALCRRFLATSAAGSESTEPARRRESLVRALLNHNDFIAIR